MRLAVLVLLLCAGPAVAALGEPAPAPLPARIGTALILAVDVSGSVDAERFRLQRDGIADALSDPAVQNVLLSPAAAPLVITVVTWADRARIAVPWTPLATLDDMRAFALRVGKIDRVGGSFTCVSAMLGFIADRVLASLPSPARHSIVDVSGDGSENCNPSAPASARRDELVALGATINGLPILEGREAATIEDWYAQNVIGGQSAFTIAARDFGDVGRAMRLKFTTEVSRSRQDDSAVRFADHAAGRP
ncbi:DUF1194 domain-containing protein [Enterovirga sp. CN4-39]|uniref:DUF1194 domain-containing protein n=1 Tax=Enterovirga sp. CN4-39 TaxID=3400910 RepID=UPI003C02BB5C